MGTNIDIIDTGYPNVEKNGEELTTQANSGSSFSIEVQSITIQRGSGNDDRAVIGSFTDVEISKNSSENQKFNITGKINRTEANRTTIIALDELTKTQGVKLISETNSTDGSYSVVYFFGYENKDDDHVGSGNELSLNTPHLHAVFTSCRFTDDAQNRTTLRFSLEGYITGETTT